MAIRIEQDNNISGFQMKETAHGWGNFADILSNSLKQITVLKQLQDSLSPKNEELSLPARQSSG
jgi:hypothetical protein